MNRISYVYLTSTFMLIACLATSNLYAMKKGSSSSSSSDISSQRPSLQRQEGVINLRTRTSTSEQPTSSSESQSDRAKKPLLSRVKDVFSRKKPEKSDSTSDSNAPTGRPGWTAPAEDRDLLTPQTKKTLEKTVTADNERIASIQLSRDKAAAKISDIEKSLTQEGLKREEREKLLSDLKARTEKINSLNDEQKKIEKRVAAMSASLDKSNEPIRITLSGKTPDAEPTIKEFTREQWNAMTARERKAATYRDLEKGSEERKAGKEAYMASLTTKERQEHEQHSADKKAAIAQKVGLGSLGTVATIGAGALVTATAATAKALSGDGEQKSSGDQAQVQIFEGGAQPTTSGVEGDTFQPTGDTSTSGDSSSGGNFTAVGPID